MARPPHDRATPSRRFGIGTLRQVEPDAGQLALGLTLVVVAIVGLVYTLTL
jgi:hypothetical protein